MDGADLENQEISCRVVGMCYVGPEGVYGVGRLSLASRQRKGGQSSVICVFRNVAQASVAFCEGRIALQAQVPGSWSMELVQAQVWHLQWSAATLAEREGQPASGRVSATEGQGSDQLGVTLVGGYS